MSTIVENVGSYLFEVPYADDREFVMEIMKFGPEVEVLALRAQPKHVSDLHKEAARRSYCQ